MRLFSFEISHYNKIQYTQSNHTIFILTAPSIPPGSISCGQNEQRKLQIVATQIPWSGWNGKPYGYRVLYKKTDWNQALNLSTGPFTPGNLTSYASFNSSDLSNDILVDIEMLEVFTKYEIFVGGYTSVGLGSMGRIVCRTTEGGRTCFFFDWK